MNLPHPATVLGVLVAIAAMTCLTVLAALGDVNGNSTVVGFLTTTGGAAVGAAFGIARPSGG